MRKRIELGSEEYLKETQIALDKTIRLISNSLVRLPNEKDDLAMSFSLMAGPILDSSHSLIIVIKCK